MSVVQLKNVTKNFGNTIAVNNISLDIYDGEYLCLLGPSGCGKTTMLRLISGLTLPATGKILIDEQDVTWLPVYKRDIAIVFQNYALFPHMKIYDNVAFGLRMQKMDKTSIKENVESALNLVGLWEVRNRYPKQLSGGQQQRIALARALVLKPRVLLLDEPLSNLDAKLRKQMRSELKRLHREISITTVHVTHDQEEALSIADRIAVMRDGAIQQIGKPQEIYDAPKDSFMAEFIGSANLIEGTVLEGYAKGGSSFYRLRFDADLNLTIRTRNAFEPGEKILVGIRPEKINVRDRATSSTVTASPLPDSNPNRFRGAILLVHYLGAILEAHIQVGGTVFIAHVPSSSHKGLAPSQEVEITCHPQDFFVIQR